MSPKSRGRRPAGAGAGAWHRTLAEKQPFDRADYVRQLAGLSGDCRRQRNSARTDVQWAA
jgi:hypothetical protein